MLKLRQENDKVVFILIMLMFCNTISLFRFVTLKKLFYFYLRISYSYIKHKNTNISCLFWQNSECFLCDYDDDGNCDGT